MPPVVLLLSAAAVFTVWLCVVLRYDFGDLAVKILVNTLSFSGESYFSCVSTVQAPSVRLYED